MVESFLKYLQYEKRFSVHTVLAYQQDLDQLSQYLSETYEITNTQEATYPLLRGWVVSLMESGLAPSSVNRKLATLKSYYKFLQTRAVINQNPALKLRPLKTEKRLPTFVREGEMTVLLDQIPFTVDFQGMRDKLILEMLYATGIRLSELIGLKDSDVNLFQGQIKVLGKRNKERVIPIHEPLRHLISGFIKVRNQEFPDCEKFLILTDSGTKLYPVFVYRIVKRYLNLVTTVTKKSPHVLRHTFATHLLNKGADLNAVKDLLGHTSLAATQVYTHNSMEKLKSVFDQAHPKA